MGTKKINKPADLPDCLIIDTLIEKSNSKNNYDFGYIASLEELRKKVSIEVSRINELFPEYTPHDETYHLKRLFFIADQLLGEELIRSMNVTELFLLSVSLYAHDWGMAVSEAEKEAVLNGCEQRSDLSLLDDEKYRIGEFCKSRNIGIGNIGQDEWREYVRLTHAFRSGKRVKSHFETVNSGIGECAASICEGHWLDFSKIEDHHSYPVDATVNRDIVNVRALAIYVRLVDLLDLGEDRTPFVLWKFVAPRNAFSKMEWAKHRCLRPVTFPSYQNHRCVKVEGSTDDHNVYMSIMDLKRYADDQFRRSSDILNRTNHGYHKLDISHIEWCIIPRGFEPVPVQFEFDRNRMFDILGDEIYRGDPYVFVRELLQNAIDAIRMRSEILERKDLTLKPRIAIQVTESEDGYMVEVSDNGIGMDEYIIKNYLSVAGKSYYRSCDFEREGLKMDPISRFGIGILSCFMVADRIDICTCKDSYTTTKPEQFKISIPAKENYFKISRPAERLEIGTTFKVFVHKSKLPKEEKTGKTIDFDVTEYLKRTAGFVKYPIYITDRGVETTIYDPDTQPLPGENAHSLQYAYDFEKAFPPQFVSVAKEYFVEKRYHLRDDLKMSGYDGCITFLVPKSDSIDITDEGTIDYNDFSLDYVQIRKIRDLDLIRDSLKGGFFREYCHVFMDGILLKNADYSYIYKNHERSFALPFFNVNISKKIGLKIDLARTDIDSKERWDAPVCKAFFDYLKEHEIKEYLSQPLDKRILSLARLLTFYKLSAETVFQDLIEPKKFPLLFVSQGGSLVFHEFDPVKFEFIQRITVSNDNIDFADLLTLSYSKNRYYKGILKKWKGKDTSVYIEDAVYDYYSLNNICTLNDRFIEECYYLHNIQFVSSPRGTDFPLIVDTLKLKLQKEDNHDKEATLSYDLNKIDEYHLFLLDSFLRKELYYFPKLVRFPKPYDDKIFYEDKYLNFNSEFVKDFIRLYLKIISLGKELPKDVAGRLADLVNEIPFFQMWSISELNIVDINRQIKELFDTAAGYGLIEKKEFNITFDDFVPNTIRINTDTDSFRITPEYEYFEGDNEWGMPIE